MKAQLLLLIPALACSAPQYLHKGVVDGVEIGYRWNHPAGKPSELLLMMRNTTAEDKVVKAVIDLSYQGLTVETFEADTCIPAGRTFNGKVNGFYFVPERLTPDQIRSGDAVAELTSTAISNASCP